MPEKFKDKEKEQNSEKLPYYILDLGSGLTPALVHSEKEISEFVKNTNRIFIGLDIDKKEIETGKGVLNGRLDLVHQAQEAQGRTCYILGDTSVNIKNLSLPFRNNSINEVFTCNLMTSRAPNFTDMVQEIKRILKSGGLLKIIETYGAFPGDYEDIRNWLDDFLSKHGFVLEKCFNREENKEEFDSYFQEIAIWSGRSCGYLIIARKK
jgi:SAM-dependent methyltransferase